MSGSRGGDWRDEVRVTPAQLDALLTELGAVRPVDDAPHLDDAALASFVLDAATEDEVRGIEAHLEACRGCAVRAAQLAQAAEFWQSQAGTERLVALRASVLRDLQKESPEQEGDILLWVSEAAGKGWRWLSRASEAGAWLVAADAGARAVGGWRLTAAQPRVSLAEGTETPQVLALSHALPDGSGELSVEVTPEYRPTLHRFVWRIRVTLSADSQVAAAFVGLADQAGSAVDRRTVRPGGTAELEVEPATGAPYWLHVEWRRPDDPSDSWQTAALELALRAARESGQ